MSNPTSALAAMAAAKTRAREIGGGGGNKSWGWMNLRNADEGTYLLRVCAHPEHCPSGSRQWVTHRYYDSYQDGSGSPFFCPVSFRGAVGKGKKVSKLGRGGCYLCSFLGGYTEDGQEVESIILKEDYEQIHEHDEDLAKLLRRMNQSWTLLLPCVVRGRIDERTDEDGNKLEVLTPDDEEWVGVVLAVEQSSVIEALQMVISGNPNAFSPKEGVWLELHKTDTNKYSMKIKSKPSPLKGAALKLYKDSYPTSLMNWGEAQKGKTKSISYTKMRAMCQQTDWFEDLQGLFDDPDIDWDGEEERWSPPSPKLEKKKKKDPMPWEDDEEEDLDWD